MFCKTCGNKIDNDSIFCSFCGTKQSDINKPVVNDIDLPIQDEPKTVNLNLSFGRQNTTKPIQETKQFKQPKYDPTYTKESDATIFGVVILLFFLLLAIIGSINFSTRDSHNQDSYNQFIVFSSLVDLVLRVFVTIRVVAIAKRQNRKTFGWGVFAFFLPSIALIIIGQLRKRNIKFEINDSLSKEENSKILSDKAQEYYNENKYSESIQFSKKAIELNSENEAAKAILKKITSSREPVFSQAKSEEFFEIVSRYTDEELLTIINVRQNSYAPTFLTAVEEEIKNRNLHNS